MLVLARAIVTPQRHARITNGGGIRIVSAAPGVETPASTDAPALPVGANASEGEFASLCRYVEAHTR